MSDDDLIRRGDALKSISMALNNATGDLYDAYSSIAALPAVTMGVKPLVWGGDHIRTTANGMGRIYECWRCFHGQKGSGWSDFNEDWHPTLEDAKAAAQADYAARILALVKP